MAAAWVAARTTIVVPCFNEEQRLDVEAIREFAGRTPAVRLLFVDDGSEDGTRRVLAELHESAPDRIQTLALDQNRGKAEAVRVGVLHALAQESEFVGFWDADLSTPLEEIEVFVQLLEERPELLIVLGSRVRLLGREIVRLAVRHYLGRIFATAVSLVLSLPVYDTQCGAKLLRVTPAVAGLFERPFLSRWVFDIELLARLTVRAREEGVGPVEELVYEHPLATWRDVPGTKLTVWSYLKSGWDVLSIYRQYRRK